ncbi:MAG: polysaccharide deacetylase family protein [Rickettsiales bacterium]|nr:polysaccharide deacetylase family protein [Rickettsiales bacterium]
MRKLLFILLFCALPAFAFWGEHGPGIIDNVPAAPGQGPTLYLTLDACGSVRDGYDKELVDFLVHNEIPATLFINARWIDNHQDEFAALARNPLFKIANHGTEHKPASVQGLFVYGIEGASSAAELRAEVVANADKIERLTGVRPMWYRSGTAYYDDLAIREISKMGFKIAGFAITADQGATLKASAVRSAAMQAKPGDIILAHMNKPEGETFEGLAPALSALKKAGFSFAVLPD